MGEYMEHDVDPYYSRTSVNLFTN